MRICMVMSTPFPPEEGIGYHVYNLSKKLIKRGHEVTVITRGSLKSESDLVDSIKVIRAPFIPLYPFHVNIHGFFVNRLFKSIEMEFDVVHIHTPLSPIIKTSLPIISTIHTSMIEDAHHIEVVDLKSFGIKVLTRFVSYPLVLKLIENSEVVTTVSNSVACELKEYYGFDNAIVVGNGVDEKIFSPSKEKSEENHVLYVGRLSYRKGLFDLLKCAKQICQDYYVKFVLVGRGELEDKLKKKVKEEGLQDKVVFLGHIEHKKLIHLYQNATIFVSPSHYESGPLTLLEAMACGVTVIATATGIASKTIANRENGIIIPPKFPEKMTESIVMLLKDEGLRKKLGKNARKTIEEKYTWDSVTDRVEKFYNLAMGFQ